jgi:hypothetical protein
MRESFARPGSLWPVTVGDVDVGQPLAGAFDPVTDPPGLLDGERRVVEIGDHCSGAPVGSMPVVGICADTNTSYDNAALDSDIYYSLLDPSNRFSHIFGPPHDHQAKFVIVSARYCSHLPRTDNPRLRAPVQPGVPSTHLCGMQLTLHRRHDGCEHGIVRYVNAIGHACGIVHHHRIANLFDCRGPNHLQSTDRNAWPIFGHGAFGTSNGSPSPASCRTRLKTTGPGVCSVAG